MRWFLSFQSSSIKHDQNGQIRCFSKEIAREGGEREGGNLFEPTYNLYSQSK